MDLISNSLDDYTAIMLCKEACKKDLLDGTQHSDIMLNIANSKYSDNDSEKSKKQLALNQFM